MIKLTQLFSLCLVLSALLYIQTEITVEFTPIASVETYCMEWKKHGGASWDNARSTTVTAKKKKQATATGLEPGFPYCVRMSCVDATGRNGQPGPELVVDTEQVGCTPQQKSCCTIL